MPRWMAMPVRTEGAGDCFFMAVAYAFTKSFDDALKVRRNVARNLAQAFFGMELKALGDAVTNAKTLEEVQALVPKNHPLVQTWQQTIPNAQPENGNRCPLAAWVVWLQHDVAEIAQLRKEPIGCEELRATGFLQYTLWGDTEMTGGVVERSTKRKLVVYRDNDALKNQELDNTIDIYHTTNPHHFSAVRFVDLDEEQNWRELELLDSYDEESLASETKCGGSKKPMVELVLIDPDAVASHSSRKKSVSAQYSAAPMSVPRRENAYKLCRIILEATRDAMGLAVAEPGFGAVDFNAHPDPPIFVISSNRAVWLGKYFDNLFIGKRDQTKKRAIVIVVDAAEEATYQKQLAKRPVYVVGLSGGFGMSWNRHRALKFARASGFEKAWVLDDNVEEVGGVTDVEDELLDEFPAFSYSLRGIMEQAVGFNLKKLGLINFCPFFPYNKDDLSLEQVLKVKGFNHNLDTSAVPRIGIRKTDKNTITPDTECKIVVNAYRAAIEVQLAALDIWRDENNTPIPILQVIQKPSTPRDVLKWHSDILYSIMASEQAIALKLADEWFSDAATP